MNELKIFENPEFGNVRTLETEDGKVLFCASDAASALGYSNKRDAISRHCRCVVKHDTPHPQSPDKTIEMSFITEGDVYRLIAHSKLPKAAEFESWVFEVVLPSIRKHGAYMTDDVLKKALTSPDFLIQLANELKTEQERNKRLETTVVMQNQQIAELKPRADYTDKILKNKGLVTISQIAKDYGMSAQQMNKKLYELGVQYKQSGQWLLYSKYHDKGYTHSETINITRSDGRTDIVMETKWTQKGRLFIYARLKSIGILPVIEREDDDNAEQG